LPTVLKGPRPGYILLYEEITRLIGDGTWPADHQIPSERELSSRYNLSRTTIRQALQLAAHRGVLVRVPGRGTFVAEPHIEAQLDHMIAFRQALQEQSVLPGIRLFSRDWIESTGAVADALRLKVGEPVLTVKWAPLGDMQPLGIYDSFLAPAVAIKVERKLAEDGEMVAPTYELAAAALGVSRLVCDQTFNTDTAGTVAARDLGVHAGSPVLRVHSVFTTPAGLAVEYDSAIFAGSRYSLHIVRQLQLAARGNSTWKPAYTGEEWAVHSAHRERDGASQV